MAVAGVALGGAAVGGTLEAHDVAVIAVEARVWQDVRDEGRVSLSARAAGGSWAELGTAAVPLDGRSASGRYRYGDVVLAVRAAPGHPTMVEARVWQDVRDGRKVFLSARVAGGSWADFGTVAVALDGLSASGRYRYGDAVLLLALPDPGPFPYDTYDLTGEVATPGSYAFFAAPDSVGPVVTTYEGLRDGSAVVLRVNPVEDDDSYQFDVTGEVAEPGEFAFFAAPDSVGPVITTYEGLRRDAAVLRIHASDADGVSRANLYGAVAAGHLFEWKQAEDCFVRYRVTDALAAAEPAPYREFAVRPETYAFQSCQAGDLPAAAPPAAFTTAHELPLEHLGGAQLTGFAVVHGPWQLTPHAQSQPGAVGSPPASIATEPSTGPRPQPARFRTPSSYRGGQWVESLTEARDLPYWREPSLPEGWTFRGLYIGDPDGSYTLPGYGARYSAADGYRAMVINARHVTVWPLDKAASWLTNHSPPHRIVRELRVIAGRPALVTYSPLGNQHDPLIRTSALIYDAAMECTYEVVGVDPALRGGPVALERVVAIARSLFASPNAP